MEFNTGVLRRPTRRPTHQLASIYTEELLECLRKIISSFSSLFPADGVVRLVINAQLLDLRLAIQTFNVLSSENSYKKANLSLTYPPAPVLFRCRPINLHNSKEPNCLTLRELKLTLNQQVEC